MVWELPTHPTLNWQIELAERLFDVVRILALSLFEVRAMVRATEMRGRTFSNVEGKITLNPVEDCVTRSVVIV